MNTHARRPAISSALLAAAAFALSACTSSAGAPHTAAPTTSSPAAPPPSASSSAPPAPSTPAPAASDSPSGPGPCTSSRLSVEQKNPGVGAGQYYSTLVFTNTSHTACTLTGYPGVSYVAENGVQSGNAADRAPGAVTTLTLKPGGTASATLHDSNGIGGYDPGQCQLSSAQGLRIYPPNDRAALFLPWKTDHCAGPTIHSLTITPLQ